MYPLSLVKDTEKIYAAALSPVARGFNREALAAVDKATRGDGAFSFVAYDADIFTMLEQLRRQYGDNVPKEKFQKQIEMNFRQVNAFSKAQFMRSIQGARASLGMRGGEKRQVPTVDITRGENLSLQRVDRAVRDNVSFIDNLTGDHMSRIVNAIREGVLKGFSHKEIADTISTETGKSFNQASFWAEDQVGNLFGDITQERQTSAGAPGYIWRTLKDARVRDIHEELEGTYHEWKNPPASGTGSRMFSHPGKGWRCRCFAELAWGPQDGERQLDPDKLKQHILRHMLGR